MSQMKYVTEVSEFYELLLDDKLDNLNFQFINDDMVQMTYNFKAQFVDNSKNTNIYIVYFTTSHARLMIYDKLNYLQERVLYFDTDSIIYVDDGTKHIKQTTYLLILLTNSQVKKSLILSQLVLKVSYSFLFGDNEQKSAINPILPGGGGCSATPLMFFAHNSERGKDNLTKFGDFPENI